MKSSTGEIKSFTEEELKQQLPKLEGFDLELSNDEFNNLVNENKELRTELLLKMRQGASAKYGKNYFNKK